MDRTIMGIFLAAAVFIVLVSMFKSGRAKSKSRSRAAHDSTSQPQASTSAAGSAKAGGRGESAEQNDRPSDHSDLTYDGILDNIVAASPFERERAHDLARPLTSPLESTNLFEQDKVDDLSRPITNDESEPLNLFELDKKNDLSRSGNDD